LQTLAEKLGFRVDVVRNGKAGSVVHFRKDAEGKTIDYAVRPATIAEIKMWELLEVLGL
jgi:hypothetical protein